MLKLTDLLTLFPALSTALINNVCWFNVKVLRLITCQLLTDAPSRDAAIESMPESVSVALKFRVMFSECR